MSMHKIKMLENEIFKVIQKSFQNIKNDQISQKIITVNQVKLAKDKSYVDLYVSCLNQDSEKVVSELNKFKGYFRKQISDNIKMFKTPEIRFHKDIGMEATMRVNEILKKIELKEETKKEFKEDE